MTRLKEEYMKRIVPTLLKTLNYKNPYAVPKLDKIVINMGVGKAVQDGKILEEAMLHLATITGQRPVITKARKAVSGFKLKKGKPIGVKVTLRKDRMYEFLDRLINFALPRKKDFRGLNPNSFDKFGNYTFGVEEQLIFPEIDPDKVKNILGMDITICIKCKKKEDAYHLLKEFGMPFRRS